MTLESAIHSYGYWAILVGTFLEGETVLVLGGLAAFQGFLSLPGVILAAFVGSMCGDQLFFFLGRRYARAYGQAPRLEGPCSQGREAAQPV